MKVKYKMRAECVSDVANALKVLCECGRLGAVSITGCGDIAGDVEVTFGFNGDLSNIRERLADIQDGHVMLRTAARASDYTGEQYYFDVKELHS